MKNQRLLLFLLIFLYCGSAQAQAYTVDTIGSYSSAGGDLTYLNQSNKICYIRAGTYHTFWCYNLSNIIFKPLGGQVKIYSDAFMCMRFEKQAINITIDGSGVPGYTYGFKMYGTMVPDGIIDFKDSSRNRTIKNVEIASGYAQGTGGIGINLAVYPQAGNTVLTRQNGYSMGNDTIVNCYIHGTYYEGIYEGCSHYGLTVARQITPVPQEAPVDTFYFANNIIDTCGQSAMNVGGVRGLATIANNSISHWGLHNAYGHIGGVNVNPGTQPLIKNNKFFSEAPSTIPVQGISYQGVGGTIINNEFTGVYHPLIIIRNTDVCNNISIPNIYIANNNTINSYYGLYVFGNNLDPKAVHYKNNISVDNVQDIYANGKDYTCLDSSNNQYGTSAFIKWLDAPNRNYALTAGSPAIGQGVDQSSYVKTDINLVPRVLPFDIGAEKYGGVVGDSTPIAIPGPDTTLPSSATSFNLNGSASYDPDGTIVAYKWTLVSGALGVTISNPDSAKTMITGLVPGVYLFQLKVTDSLGAVGAAEIKITVQLPPNILPVANAGADISFALPVNYTTLNGTASYDPDGSLYSYWWNQVSGPATATIVSPAAITTNISNLVQGVYTFVLTVTDNRGGIGTDTVQVTVNPGPPPPPNQPPVANAGSDITIALPTNITQLNGSLSTDPDGTIGSYSWTKIAGPAAYAITNGNAAITSVTGLVQGTYSFALTVTDNLGLSASDTVLVTVNVAPNLPPVANAGQNITIVLPVNSAYLNGTASSDADGSIASYSWIKISGPGPTTIANSNTATPQVLGLVAGQYVFQLTVTDNAGANSSSQVTVTVLAAGMTLPVARAGNDSTISAPGSVAILNGSASYSTGGSISAYAWRQISGPAAANILQPAQANTYVQQLIAGEYDFELTVTDNNGNTAKDTVKITVSVNYRYIGSSKVYPNPITGNTLSVDVMNDIMGKLSITLIDLNGRLIQEYVYDKEISVFHQQLSLPALAKGAYILSIRFAGQNNPFIYKLIKQ